MKSLLKCVLLALASCLIRNSLFSQTTNNVAKFVTPTTFTNSHIFDNGTGVGIGTVSPGTNLDVVGSGAMIRAAGTSNNDAVSYSWYHSLSGNDQSWFWQLQGSSPWTGSANRDFVLLDGGGTNFITVKSTGNILLRPNGGGNVGIGTTNPLERLSISGGAVAIGASTSPYANLTVSAPGSSVEAIIGQNTNGTAILAEGGTGYTSFKLHTNLSGTDVGGTLGIASASGIYADFATAKDVVLRADNQNLILTAASSIEFGTNTPGSNTQVMTILNSGSVGIGTTNPGTNKLAVNGNIKAKEVDVSVQGWSDFVFDKDYRLMPIDDLEREIQKNKRLPGMPSTEEVLKNGIKLGELQAKLLQKIEELTLYVIDLRKQNELLKKTIRASHN